jgi:hypothetical protein
MESLSDLETPLLQGGLLETISRIEAVGRGSVAGRASNQPIDVVVSKG